MLNLRGFLSKVLLIAPQASNTHTTSSFHSLNPYFTSTNQATVTRVIAPGKVGQVKFQGGWWASRCRYNITLHPGEIVYVVGPLGLPLDVEPDPMVDR